MPKKYTNEEVHNIINEINNGEYSWISGEYINRKSKLGILHKKCNSISYISLDYIKKRLKENKSCCHNCTSKEINNKKRLSNEEFKKQFYSLYNKNEYELLEDYIDDKTKIKILCHKCNKVFLSRPNDAKQGYMCPNCKISKGEKAIEEWLNKNNYIYIKQYSFKDLIYKKHLHFDFKVIIDNSFILIEFDGEQHYNQERCFHKDIRKYKEQQKRDEIKNNYCKMHNYKLIRITYDKLKNIDSELFNIFSDIYANME